MIDYAKKKKTQHLVIFVVLFILGLGLLGDSFWQEHQGVYRGNELAHTVFFCKYFIGCLFMIVAGLWRAVMRLSTEVAALEAKAKDVS